ncbi:unnamed protein product [Bursaphelenchus okinawaensis]|uniref:Cleavage stimulation factor 50 kDa subunit n=1 Tax=Bursaphelenchus okinawaensis TaxID=465554 RepID=A0A811K9U6_9BILA|nr:unnamed protein product [Bursaphelenchus okinawaensis]CAG9095421.1 unnamed protein product [Bursaphelenchus okinawaensis]
MAMSLAQAVGVSNQLPPPSDKLYRVVSVAKQFVDNTGDADGEGRSKANFEYETMGLDLEYDADIVPTAPEPSNYETIYVTAHKGACRAAAFSNDGSLFATGSEDSSIKILDVEKIMGRNEQDIAEGASDAHHPVIRTLYDHIADVNALAFHPREQILISGSRDLTMKIFDYSKTAVKRAMRTIVETYPVTALSFHPSGEYVLAGTTHPTLRLYNFETQQCFVSSMPRDQHTASIVDVHYSDNAKLFVTASRDGDVKVWDGVSNRCVETFQRAHDSAEVCSARFTKNGKYILTAGLDSTCKLWELSTNRCLIAYTGAGSTGPQEFPQKADFNHNEDYVMFPDEKSGSMCAWESRSGERQRLLALGHTAPCRVFTHSPTMAAFVTGSDDFRARFWVKKSQNH